jgi:glutathione S-transferase
VTEATLYGIPGSHPVKTAELMLDHKRIPFRRVDLLPGQQWKVLPAEGFPGKTVPAVLIAGGRLQGTRAISRALDELQPEPPLFPEDPTLFTGVEEAERFAEDTLQPVARRLVLAAGARDIDSLWEGGEGGALGALLAPDAETRAAIMEAAAHRVIGITDERELADLDLVPPILDRVEGWIESGVLQAGEPNAAVFQVAPSVCLLMYRDDLRSIVRARPAGVLSEAIVLKGARA